MNIILEEELEESLRGQIEAALQLALEKENIPSDICEVSVTLVSKEEIKDLNRDFRGVDSVTDVLSFPQYEREELRDLSSEEEELLPIGDVVICREKIKEQAKEYGHSEEREFVYLFTHSILHLLGYDHMEDDEKKEMRAREEEILAELGIGR